LSNSQSTLAEEGRTGKGSMPTASITRGRWIVAILATGIIAWYGFSFPPKVWRVPDELSSVGALSPKADQDKLAAVNNENLWKNTLLKFGIAGSAFGLIGFFLLGSARNGFGAAITSLLSGVVAGLATGTLGLLTRLYLNLDHPIPLISEQSRPLFCDMVVYAILGVGLLVPIVIQLCFQADSAERSKAYSVPLAGILSGLLVPIASALVLHGYTNTSTFPPESADLAALWLGALSVFALATIVFTGKRTKTIGAASAYPFDGKE